MKILDLLFLSLEDLRQHQLRSLLAAAGVAIGAALVVALVSLGLGLQANAQKQLGDIAMLRQVVALPSTALVSTSPAPQKGSLTQQAVKQLNQIPGVTAVHPSLPLRANSAIHHQGLTARNSIVGVPGGYFKGSECKLVSGSDKLEPGNLVLGQLVLSNFFNESVAGPPAEVQELVGKQVKLTLRKHLPDGSEVTRSYHMLVNGIVKGCRLHSDAAAFMNLSQVETFNRWASGRAQPIHYEFVALQVAEVSDVVPVADAVEALGFQVTAAQIYAQAINSFYRLLQWTLGIVGSIALLVSALNTANTLAMSVAQRTRQIGLMKSIGATNGQVLGLFLAQAAHIGLLGGVVGSGIGFLFSRVVNDLAESLLAMQLAEGNSSPGVLFLSPFWLILLAVAVSLSISAVAGLAPALRAAVMPPVVALKS